MDEHEKELLLVRLNDLIQRVGFAGGWKVDIDCGEYKLIEHTPVDCPEIEMVIYHLVNALGSLESIKTEG